ncbi:MAG: YqgE/AlgH family protein [Proteobacteria bacterium]|nr:YqgE/AlgH family protein [Pseudomonadota bacterium]MBU1709267.1 YqgE/AlgH family protein [Pseudomonadota bacterium]
MESLKNRFLIATPQMPDPRFQEQVIYMCVHNEEEGAMGFIINQPTAISLVEILKSAEIPVPDQQLPPVYFGGPVELEAAFFLYSTKNAYQIEHQINISDSVSLSRDPKILRDIAASRGPSDYIFLLGYAGWAPGQLENELTVNGWLTLPADYEDIFHTPDSLKWRNVAMKHGIDIDLFGDEIGTA